MEKTFTVLVEWPDGGREEVDVKATSPAQARRKATDLLVKTWTPGWVILKTIERIGFYY